MFIKNKAKEILQCIQFFASTNKNSTPKKFLIFGRGRSGSTLLVDLLNSNREIHCDGEILNRHFLFPRTQVDIRMSACCKPVYGFKLLSYQVRDVQTIKNPDNFLYQLYHDGFQIIYLKRDNLLRHAISNIRARKKQFHYRKSCGESPENELLNINIENLLGWIKGSQSLYAFEESLLQRITCLRLTYEKDLADESIHQDTADKVFEFLDLPSAKVTTDLVKSRSTKLVDIIDNYEELAEAMLNHGYAQFLD